MMYLLMGCFTAFEARNFAPTIEIVHPENGATYNEGDNVSVELLVSDEQMQNGSVSVQWRSDIDGLLSEAAPNSDGVLQINFSALSPGEHNTTLLIRDSEQLTSQLPLLLYVNAAPEVPQVEILPADPVTGDGLQASVIGGVDPEGSAVNMTFEWYRENVLFEDGDPAQPQVVPTGFVQKGENWSVRVIADDGAASSDAAYSAVLVSGVPPQISQPVIGSDSYTTSSLLSCEAQVSDADEDSVEVEYSWQILSDGAFGAVYSGPELQLGPDLIQPQDIPYCTVQATDTDGTTIESTYVTLVNQAPEISSLIIEPSAGVRPGVQVICDAEFSDPDMQLLNTSYKWYKLPQGSANRSLISLSQSLLITTDNAAKGDTLECEVRVTDSLGLEATQSTSIEVSNTAPLLQSVGLIPTFPTGTDDIECTALASDIDGDTIDYTYSWTVNGVLYPTPVVPSVFTEILVADDVVACTVSVSDSEDAGNVMSSSVTVINTPPEIIGMSITPTTIYTNDLVTAQATVVDNDGDSPLVYYRWYVDGTEVKSGLGGTLNGVTDFEKDQEILVVAYADDGIDLSISVASSPVIVQNSVPTDPEISLGGEFLSDSNDLNCEITEPSVDEDGDPITYTTLWFLDDQPYSGAVEDGINEGDYVLSTFSNPGEMWGCTVQSSDGVESSSVVSTSTILTGCTVQNYYGIYEDLSELNTVSDCWQLGRANDEESAFILPFTTFVPEDGWTTLAFDDWNFNYVDPEDPSTFVTGWKYFGHGTPSSWSSSSHEAVLSSSNATGNVAEFFLGRYCANMFGWSCRNRYLFLEEESIAVHPGDQKVFLRWTSPLNGTCDVDFYAIGSEDVTWGGFGVDGAETTTTVMLMHNHTLVSDISISVYTDISPLQQSVTVVGGDILDIVVSGNQSLAQWTGLNGGITCDFDDGTE